MDTKLIVSLILFLVTIFFWRIYPTSSLIMTRLAGIPIPFFDLLFMKWRKIDIDEVVDSYIMLKKADINIQLADLETAYLDKYNLKNITVGLILAQQQNVQMTFEQAKEADRRGIKMIPEATDQTTN